MTRIRKRTMKCAICRKESTHSVILSTSSFGSKDLDFRPPGMMRRTLPLWIQECPHCGYVNSDISEKMPVTLKMLGEIQSTNLSCFNPDNIAAIRFYKLYVLKKTIFDSSPKNPNDYDLLLDAFYSVLHAAWVCDDKREPDGAIICRKKALQILNELQLIYTKDSSFFLENFSLDRVFIMKADLMRRAGLFEKLLSEFEEIPLFSDPSLSEIIRFHINKAKAGDTRCYTFDYVNSGLWKKEV